MIRNIVDLGNAAGLKGDLAAAIAAFEANRDLPALRAELAGEGTDLQLQNAMIIILRAGALQLRSGGSELLLQPGDVASVPAGSIAWRAEGAEVVLAEVKTGAADCAFTKLDLDQELSPGGLPNPALVTTAMPETARHEFFDASAFSWGLWSATPYDRSAITYPFSELMYLQSGSVTVGNYDEGRQTFRAGDVFIIHRGAKAAWSNSEPVKKFWLIHRPE